MKIKRTGLLFLCFSVSIMRAADAKKGNFSWTEGDKLWFAERLLDRSDSSRHHFLDLYHIYEKGCSGIMRYECDWDYGLRLHNYYNVMDDMAKMSLTEKQRDEVQDNMKVMKIRMRDVGVVGGAACNKLRG